MSEPTDPFAPERNAADLAAARIARRVLEQWWLIALCAVIAAGAAYVASSQRTKEYEATTTIQVGTIDLISVFLEQDISVTDTDPERATNAAIELFNLPDVRDRAAKYLGRDGTPMDAEAIGAAVRIENAAQSDVLRVIATGPDPKQAMAISNAMTEAFSNQRRAAARGKLITAQDRISRRFDGLSKADKASETGAILQDRLKQVGALSALSDGNVEIIQAAREPTAPVSPKPKRDLLLGLLAGLLLGGGVALLRARLDDRIRDTDELTSLWPLPVVGLVPQSAAFKKSGRAMPDGAALEALSLARTNLRYLHVGGTVKTVAVTSALEGEGKSTITWNLAVAASLAKSKVIVVEADLRRPVMTGRLEVTGPGLSEVLAGLATVEETIQTITVESPDEHRASTQVDFLPAGLVPPSPVALLEGPETKATLATLRKAYDIVLIDTPPATIVADTMAIVDEIDGVLIVSRLGTVRRTPVKRLRELLTSVDAPVIGQIVNSDAAAKNHSYYTAYTADKKPFWKRTPAGAGAGAGDA